jgi:hypothetical protein
MRTVLIAVLGLMATGCSDDHHDPGPDDSYNCAADTRGEEFVVGLEKVGAAGALDFRLMSADPSPPSRGDNTWTLQLNAMSGGTVGSPQTGATITVTPFMPDHQHGTAIRVLVEEMADPGRYKLSPVNLWMPGVWETTIQASTPSGTDEVVYTFCLPS